jgi:predicted ribosomally synthesized peptide with nif11-like leader
MKGAKEFVEFVKSNPDFLKELSGLSSEEVKAKIEGAGFSFTKEELLAAQDKNKELSDEELEQVAGGSCDYDTFSAFT